MNFTERFAATAQLAAEYPVKLLGRFVQLFLMTTQEIAALFSDGDDYIVLGHLNAVYASALNENAAGADRIATSLADYYLREGRHKFLSLEEANAGLGIRMDSRLWERFLALGMDETFVRARIADEAQAEIERASFHRHKAAYDRRLGRLMEAEAALKALLGILEKEPADKGRIAFVEYELGIINLLQAHPEAAINYNQASAVHAREGGDPVGEWIGRCQEYYVRWLYGHASHSTTLTVLKAAQTQLVRLSRTTKQRRQTARRWITNSLTYQIEVHGIAGEAAEARTALQEMTTPPISEGLPKLDGYLHIYEGMVALAEKDPKAVEWFSKSIEQKFKNTTPYLWMTVDASAVNYYYLGLALKQAGNVAQAKDAWAKALELPNAVGNQLWQSRAKSELGLLSIFGV